MKIRNQPGLYAALLSLFLVFAFATETKAVERIALVIGNDTYAHAPVLRNAVADSKLVAEVLKEAGFTVIALENAGVDRFYDSLEELKRRSGLARVGLIYFAGHGIEVEGKNFLLPVDAELVSPGQLRSQTIALDTVLRDMAEARLPAKLIILDCCRDNPVGRNWISTRSVGKGLAAVRDSELPEAALVMFSAGPGQVALDGTGDNSPFTEALAKRLRQPGQNVFDAFLQTSDDVVNATGRRQEPWLKFDGAGRTFRELVFLPSAGAPDLAAAGKTELPVKEEKKTEPELGNSKTEPLTAAVKPDTGAAHSVVAAGDKADASATKTEPGIAPAIGTPKEEPALGGGEPKPDPLSAAKEPTPTVGNNTAKGETSPAKDETLSAIGNNTAGAAAADAATIATPAPEEKTVAATTGGDLPPASEETVPAIGSTSMAATVPGSGSEARSIAFPSRGYFNNAEVFKGGPYESYNSATLTSILRSVQEQLTDAGRPDGQMGRNTQTAIIAYQEEHSLTVTGLLDSPTLESMGLLGLSEVTPVTTPKSSTTAVRKPSSSTPTRSGSSSSPPRSPSPPPPPPSQPSNKLWKPAGDSPGTMSHSRKKFLRPG